jgi:hypothetical protein
MDSLTRANQEFASTHPGESARRQPVHVVYGGAHLFKHDIAQRVGTLARKAFAEYSPDAATLALALGIRYSLADIVYQRVIDKLRVEPVEDYRIDFEDGYGIRPDAEEDAVALSCATALARGVEEATLPAFIGIRIKALNEESKVRSFRTLRIFLENAGTLPGNFVVTLPKVTVPEQVTALRDFLEPYGVRRFELMIETPQSVFLLPQLIEQSRGSLSTIHFGAYDYTASLGIANQHILHPACDFARSTMQALAAGTGVQLSDGATNILPLPIHRTATPDPRQCAENRGAVHAAWKLHFEHVRRSLDNGFYQSWDLHPAQLVSRYAAVYSFFLEGQDQASDRLRNFIAKAAQATRVGGIFDDAATGQGLMNYFLRALNCGAIPESEIPALTGLSLDELRSGSFSKIIGGVQV